MPSSAVARGVLASTPKPVSKTTSATGSSNLSAVAAITYGDVSFVSYSGGTLCLSVPVTVSNTGNGRVYYIQLHVSVQAWDYWSAKTGLTVPAQSSRQTTFSFCYSNFTQPDSTCYSALLGSRYWGDPDPALGDLGSESTGKFCVPHQP